MATPTARKRLLAEMKDLKRKPTPGIRACPNEKNILEVHYCVDGPADSPYEGGYYHGKLKFPADYPYKPPSIYMLTPSGRFQTGTRLCMSMSDFHPDTWSPLWSVRHILLGLVSFMVEDTATAGSIVSSTAEKRAMAARSLAFNIKSATFCKMFPEMVEEYRRIYDERKAACSGGGGGSGAADASSGGSGGGAGAGGGSGAGAGAGTATGAGAATGALKQRATPAAGAVAAPAPAAAAAGAATGGATGGTKAVASSATAAGAATEADNSGVAVTALGLVLLLVVGVLVVQRFMSGDATSGA